MNKKRILWILLDLVFLIIFNTIFFMLGGVHDEELDYVKRGSSELRALIGLANDKKTARQMEFLYDLIYSSPVKSHPSVKVYERNVLALIEQLRTDIANGDDTNIHSIMDKIKENAELRNRKLQVQSQR